MSAVAVYKLTSVGVIPDSWSVKQLGEIAQVRSGIAKNARASVTNPISVHYLRVANVQDGFLDLSDLSQIEISQSSLQRFSVLPGDVLMNEGGDLDKLGRGAIWRGEFDPCVHQNHVFVVRCGATISPDYLNIWASGTASRSYFLVAGKQTTNLASISKTALCDLPVAIPPLVEQRAIAAALNDVDALLSGLDRLIAKKRDLKQAAMQQLLTGQTRLPGFYGEWEVKRLGDCLLEWPDYGINAPAVAYLDRLPTYIRITDISESGCFQPAPRVSVQSAFADQYMLSEGDIVFARTGASVGKAYRYRLEDGPLVFAGFLIRVRPNPIFLVSAYLAAYATTKPYWNWVTLMSMRSGQPGINGNEYAQLPLRLPSSVAEQTAIATVFSDMDTELSTLEARRNKTRTLKQAMMQELLTGRTRLIPTEGAAHA
jgi:type I restriction enzyme S subunit